MAEWLKATDCKSVPARVRWFESTPAQILKKRLDLVLTSFFVDFGRWMRTTQGEALSVVRARSEQSAEDFCEIVFYCPFCSEVFFVIARAKARSNLVLADFKWSEI